MNQVCSIQIPKEMHQMGIARETITVKFLSQICPGTTSIGRKTVTVTSLCARKSQLWITRFIMKRVTLTMWSIMIAFQPITTILWTVLWTTKIQEVQIRIRFHQQGITTTCRHTWEGHDRACRQQVPQNHSFSPREKRRINLICMNKQTKILTPSNLQNQQFRIRHREDIRQKRKIYAQNRLNLNRLLIIIPLKDHLNKSLIFMTSWQSKVRLQDQTRNNLRNTGLHNNFIRVPLATDLSTRKPCQFTRKIVSNFQGHKWYVAKKQ